ncbi:met regulon transcriptional regulator MetJ [Rhodanobacter sp. AS-Z3]|nr:met regulon transcriptional regulator MetJ [Rhodanobacter sp. AS-Z3]WEN16916.1 met regulon transcriptional regulator MetJ [Rhodanobacter sp. AS-Z3]
MATTKFIKPYVEHGEKANAVRKITVSIPLHVLRRLSDLRTHRQVNNLRHATNSDVLVEAFLHAFTGQPLPTDEELRRTMATAKKPAAKKPAAKKAAAKKPAVKKVAAKKPAAAKKVAAKKPAAKKVAAKKPAAKKVAAKKPAAKKVAAKKPAAAKKAAVKKVAKKAAPKKAAAKKAAPAKVVKATKTAKAKK